MSVRIVASCTSLVTHTFNTMVQFEGLQQFEGLRPTFVCCIPVLTFLAGVLHFEHSQSQSNVTVFDHVSPALSVGVGLIVAFSCTAMFKANLL